MARIKKIETDRNGGENITVDTRVTITARRNRKKITDKGIIWFKEFIVTRPITYSKTANYLFDNAGKRFLIVEMEDIETSNRKFLKITTGISSTQ